MNLMKEMQEFLNKQKAHDNKNITLHSRNRIRCLKCGQEGYVQNRCIGTAPDSDQKLENSH